MSQAAAIRFIWSGKYLSGQKVNGESEATDIESLRRVLYSQGILLSSVRKSRTATTFIKKRKIPAAEMTVFFRQCASLLQAGLPLVQAMEICIESVTRSALKQELQRVRDQLAGGTSFYSALRGSSLGQDRLLLNLVSAAEQSGTLDTMMGKLADDSEKTQQLLAKVKKALMYPVAVFVIAIIVTVLLLVKVVPQFVQTFSHLGAELPALTRSVLMLSDLVIRHMLAACTIALIAAIGVTACLQRYRRARLWKDKLACWLPVFGSIVKHACLARFCQILSCSITAGVPLLPALQSAASATGNLVYEQACLELAELVNQGQPLSFGIRKTPCFPVMIGQLIYAGEQSGTLDQMLENCARRYEQAVDNAVDKLSSLIEPAVMTVLGVIIATLLLAMYLPVFRLGAVL